MLPPMHQFVLKAQIDPELDPRHPEGRPSNDVPSAEHACADPTVGDVQKGVRLGDALVAQIQQRHQPLVLFVQQLRVVQPMRDSHGNRLAWLEYLFCNDHRLIIRVRFFFRLLEKLTLRVCAACAASQQTPNPATDFDWMPPAVLAPHRPLLDSRWSRGIVALPSMALNVARTIVVVAVVLVPVAAPVVALHVDAPLRAQTPKLLAATRRHVLKLAAPLRSQPLLRVAVQTVVARILAAVTVAIRNARLPRRTVHMRHLGVGLDQHCLIIEPHALLIVVTPSLQRGLDACLLLELFGVIEGNIELRLLRACAQGLGLWPPDERQDIVLNVGRRASPVETALGHDVLALDGQPEALHAADEEFAVRIAHAEILSIHRPADTSVESLLLTFAILLQSDTISQARILRPLRLLHVRGDENTVVALLPKLPHDGRHATIGMVGMELGRGEIEKVQLLRVTYAPLLVGA
mmetsp:Transcript_98076/g.277375  ORF Transcript_98076/g.277375 Transcript_98076/m.277375 type:complete len:464 (-) Transcript_98076:310-1701(-)